MGSHQRGRITLYCVADSFDRKKLDEVGGSGCGCVSPGGGWVQHGNKMPVKHDMPWHTDRYTVRVRVGGYGCGEGGDEDERLECLVLCDVTCGEAPILAPVTALLQPGFVQDCIQCGTKSCGRGLDRRRYQLSGGQFSVLSSRTPPS